MLSLSLALSLSLSLSFTLSPYVEISFSYQMLPACTDRQTIPIFMKNHEGMCESWWLGDLGYMLALKDQGRPITSLKQME